MDRHNKIAHTTKDTLEQKFNFGLKNFFPLGMLDRVHKILAREHLMMEELFCLVLLIFSEHQNTSNLSAHKTKCSVSKVNSL